MGRRDWLHGYDGVDVSPTGRQLIQALELLIYDFAYYEEREIAKRYLVDFAHRWGHISNKTLMAIARRFAPAPDEKVALGDAAVLDPQTPEEKDVVFTLAVLGVLNLPDTPSLLLPYLTSPRAQERWLAACGLVAMRDERVLPAIERMLTEFVGPNLYRFQVLRHWLLRRLADWGDPRIVPALRAGLIANVRAEEVEAPEPCEPEQEFTFGGKRYTGPEAWKWFYNEQLFWVDEEHLFVYALGRMDAFGALEDVPARRGIYSWQDAWKDDGKGGVQLERYVPESHAETFRANVWRVHMCFGALESRFRGKIQTIYNFAGAPELAKAVEELLAGKFGMDEAARRRAMEDYDQESWVYWTLFKYAWDPESARETYEDEEE